MRLHEFYGIKVEVFNDGCLSYPWRFRLHTADGKTHNYCGMPNKCLTPHSALMRGWYRAKWMALGVYDKHYR